MYYARRAARIGSAAAVGYATRKAMGWAGRKMFGGGSKNRFVTWRSQSRLSRRVANIERGRFKELKTYDEFPYNDVVGTTGTIVAISDMAQGDTSITREGLIIQPRNLQFKLRLYPHASNANNIVRVIIFCDREQHGTIPTVAELLESDQVISFAEHDTRPRFKIHRDFLLVCTPEVGPVIETGMIKFGKRSKIWYQGTTGAAASLGKNQLYVYVVGDDGTNTPALQMNTRLRFVDG